jgi:hypothetical protein
MHTIWLVRFIIYLVNNRFHLQILVHTDHFDALCVSHHIYQTLGLLSTLPITHIQLLEAAKVRESAHFQPLLNSFRLIIPHHNLIPPVPDHPHQVASVIHPAYHHHLLPFEVPPTFLLGYPYQTLVTCT